MVIFGGFINRKKLKNNYNINIVEEDFAMKKFLGVLCFSLVLGTVPAYAVEADINAVVANEVGTRINDYYYGSKTIASGQMGYYKNSTGNFLIPANKRVTFSCKLNKSANIKICYHDTISGKTTILYIGNTFSKSISFSKSSRTSGYFTITNNSGSPVTVTSASVYY